MAYAKLSGVYRIHCAGNKKVYIGSSVSIRQRLATHFSMLKRGKHSNKHLQNAYNSYGEDSFFADILEMCSEDMLIEREQYWIDYYAAANPDVGMNNSWVACTTLGFRHSDETKQAISDMMKGKYPAHLKAANDNRAGKPAHNKGKPGMRWTDEMKKKSSESHRGQMAWNKGKPSSEETKRKISEKTSLARAKYGSEYVDRIHQLKSKGMNTRQIAESTGVSQPTVSRILRGDRTFERIKGKV